MLRRVAIDGVSVRDATIAFGFSRQAFNHAKADFEQNGVAGLMPFKRRPKENHKLIPEVLDFIRESRENDPSVRLPELTRRVKERFDIEIDQQSIQQAIGRIRNEPQGLAATLPATFVSNDLEIDFAARRVRAGQNNVHLTPTEFDILRYLFSHAGKPIPHRTLVQLVWGRNSVGDLSCLRVYVNQLRKKIEPNPSEPRYILTEPWVGYRFIALTE
jgi:transposase